MATNKVTVPANELERLIRLAETGAYGLMEPARGSAIADIRYIEALFVTATGRSPNFP